MEERVGGFAVGDRVRRQSDGRIGTVVELSGDFLGVQWGDEIVSFVSPGDLQRVWPTSGTQTPPPPSWPALAPAPVSDVQTCSLAWLKGGDWSAARGLLDALEERNRHDDAKRIREAIAAETLLVIARPDLQRVVPYPGWWQLAMTVLWFDLFDLGETLAQLEKGT